MPEDVHRHRLSSGITVSRIAPTGVVFVSSAVGFAVLLAARPHRSSAVTAWRGDELAISSTWLIAIVCTAWLALTTLACLAAVARGDHGLAAGITRFAPPFTRRILQAAAVSAFAFAPTAAHAEAGSLREVPVVRAPPSTTAPAAPLPPTTTTPSAPRPTVAAAPVSPAPVPPASERTYVVRAGDNLWLIAKTEVVRRGGGAATDARLAQYWQHVIAANRTTLRSGDPSLIFPGEVVALPLD